MLLEHEICVGDLYAWDYSTVTHPMPGCNLFKILEDTKSDFSRLIVESVDGCLVFDCGPHCLTTVKRSLERLNVLNSIEPPEENTHERWVYDQEVKNLSKFKDAYDKHLLKEKK